jgi:protein involved in polysaccharide export with SLBB domain
MNSESSNRRGCVNFAVAMLVSGSLLLAQNTRQQTHRELSSAQLGSSTATNNHLTSRFRRLHLQADLRLGPGDLAEIKVYGAPELSDTLRVSSGGEIAMPLIGVVKVAGLTPEQVQKEIAQRLLVGGFFARPARQHPD